MLWHDRRLIDGAPAGLPKHPGQTTLRPFGLLFIGDHGRAERRDSGSVLDARGTEQAGETCAGSAGTSRGRSTPSGTPPGPAGATTSTGSGWRAAAGPAHGVATSLYHSLIKPCFGDDGGPFWPSSGPFAFDVWHDVGIYKTQLPLLGGRSPGDGPPPARIADPGL